MTSTLLYEGELRTSCIHLKSSESIITDAPTDNNGKGKAFSPTDLVATALASCMLTVMGIKANQIGVNIDGTTAKVKKVMASNPRRIDHITIQIDFPDHELNEEDRKSLIHVAEHCPVAKSIHPEIVQEVSFNF